MRISGWKAVHIVIHQRGLVLRQGAGDRWDVLSWVNALPKVLWVLVEHREVGLDESTCPDRR